ncbi:MAG: rod shape-determining protein MreC [Peptoniphilaceae bacterium]|nr:rod shape-determining protein MreC [Peptoniphilaceae bacterium]MDD7383322.1 rod shape-determining protein MreC [Peptoniphilaceae bacterium]MDY3738307.1 rod shape-determining protein MreC [Peptoniphilaceae bacterium]
MAYYRKKKNNKGFVLTIIALIFLIIFSYFNKTAVEISSKATNTILEPINKFTYMISSSVVNAIEDTFGTRQTKQKVEELTVENKKLQDTNKKLTEIINREDFLKAEWKAIKNSSDKLIEAYTIGQDLNAFTENIIIDKGKQDGVEVGDIILQAIDDSDYYTGIVGKVTSVSKYTSKVKTILSPENNIAFVNSASGDYGVINKFSEKRMQGYMLEIQSEVSKGDVLLTSGIGGVYPRNYYIGKVESVDISDDGIDKNITVSSKVDFSHLYRLFVLKDGEKNE